MCQYVTDHSTPSGKATGDLPQTEIRSKYLPTPLQRHKADHLPASLAQAKDAVVYKGEDTKLDRPVALRFLRSEATENADAKARFLRRTAASCGGVTESILNSAIFQMFLAQLILEERDISTII